MMFCIFIASITHSTWPVLHLLALHLTSIETTRPGIGETTRREVSGGVFHRQPLV